MSEQKVVPLNLGEVIQCWNQHYDEFQPRHAGRYLMLLPLNTGGFEEIADDDPHKLRRLAEERGYKFPLIDLVPRGNETEW